MTIASTSVLSNAIYKIGEKNVEISNALTVNSNNYAIKQTLVNYALTINNNSDLTIDTTKNYNKIGYIISFMQGDTKIPIPDGIIIRVGNNSCYKESDGKCRLVVNNDFTNKSGVIEIDYQSYLQDTIENLFIKVETVVSYNGKNLGTIIDTDTLGINLINNPVYNLKIELDDYDDKVLNFNTNHEIPFNITTSNIPEGANAKININLKEKVEGTMDTYNLIDLGTYSNDYPLDANSEYTLPSVNGNIIIVINDNIPVGTYKMEFKLYVNNEVKRIEEYNFVVK